MQVRYYFQFSHLTMEDELGATLSFIPCNLEVTSRTKVANTISPLAVGRLHISNSPRPCSGGSSVDLTAFVLILLLQWLLEFI